MSSEEQFDQWAIVELMGHQRVAGRVTEQQVSGTSFIRVDVPAVGERDAFTRLLGSSAIFAINIVTEDVALAAAANFRAVPVSAFDIPRLRQMPMHATSTTRCRSDGRAKPPPAPLRLERWRVPPGWRWFRLPGYARRWDLALEVERIRSDPVLQDYVDYRIALDQAVERINAFSRLVRRAAERGRSR